MSAPRAAAPRGALRAGEGLLAVVALALAAHAGVLSSRFAYDDFETLFGTFSDPVDAATARPWRAATFAFDRAFWGNLPFGYHLSDLLAHAACAAAVWALAGALGAAARGAALAGLLYAAHPVLSEPVANVSNRKETWLVLFSLLSALCFLRMDLDRRWRWASLAFLAAAAAAKEAAAALPALLLLCDRARRGSWRAIRAGDHLPFWGLALAAGWVLYLRRFGPASAERAVHLDLLGMGGAELWSVSGEALGRSVRLLALPVGLSPDHPAPEPLAAGAWILAAACCAAAFAVLRLGRGPTLALGCLWTLAAWLPAAPALTPTVYPVAERYWALPWAGLCVALGAAAARLWERAPRAVPAAAAGVLLCWTVLSADRDRAWRSDLPLWADALRENPRSAPGHLSWANAYGSPLLERPDAALREFRMAIECQPAASFPFYLWGRWELSRGSFKAARKGLEEAHRRGFRSTQLFADLVDLAVREGRVEEALGWIREAASSGRDPAGLRERLERIRKGWDAAGIDNPARREVESAIEGLRTTIDDRRPTR